MEHIHHCKYCKMYTLELNCPKCGKQTIQPKPAKFSLSDKYAGYRLEEKKKLLRDKGLY